MHFFCALVFFIQATNWIFIKKISSIELHIIFYFTLGQVTVADYEFSQLKQVANNKFSHLRKLPITAFRN